MNPAVAATSSGGLAGAVVACMNAILGHWAIVPDAGVVTSEVTIATVICGVALHYLTRVAPDLAPVLANQDANPAAKP